jgi:hypothetical protein
VDATPGGDGCIGYTHTICVGGSSHWADSCGAALEELEDCTAPQDCYDPRGICCRPPVTGALGVVENEEGKFFTTLASPTASLRIPIDLEITPADGEDTFITFDFSIDGTHLVFYFHNEFDLEDDTINQGVALVLTGTSDVNRVRDPGGGQVLSLGAFNAVIVRRNFDWSEGGTFELLLERKEPQGAADWYDFAIIYDGNQRQEVGGATITRATANTPATIETEVKLDVKISNSITQYQNSPSWKLSYDFGDTAVVGVRSEYVGTGVNEHANINMRFEAESSRMHVELGPNTWRCDAEGTLL